MTATQTLSRLVWAFAPALVLDAGPPAFAARTPAAAAKGTGDGGPWIDPSEALR